MLQLLLAVNLEHLTTIYPAHYTLTECHPRPSTLTTL